MAKLDDLLGAFGTAIVSAQSQILQAAKDSPSPMEGLQTAFTISETEIEVRLIFDEQGGATAVKPVSAGASRLQDLNPGVLSTLRAKLLVVPGEEAAAPKSTPGKVGDQVLKRPDVQRLAEIFGDLRVN